MKRSGTKVGIFVDVANLAHNGGYGMRYDVLREFACRDGAEPVRLNAYVSFDAERAKQDATYKNRTSSFFSSLRDFGYKVIQKKIKWYVDENGNRFGKANADLDMAVDALLQSEKLDRVMLATGDGDFIQVVRALQNKGCRVEALAFENISNDLKSEADLFMSGYLVPNLQPTENAENKWGVIDSVVRGTCYFHNDNGYGFFRFLNKVGSGLWITDARQENSPFETAFFHDSQLPPEIHPGALPSRHHVFEFVLTKGERGFQAQDVKLISNA